MPRPATLAARRRTRPVLLTPDPADEEFPSSLRALESSVSRPVLPSVPHERARLLLLGAFALSGLLAFSWLARIPGVRDLLSLSAADLGGILLIGSIGALATVVSSSALLARFGSARVFAAGTVIIAVGFVLMGLGPALGSRWLFGVGILVNGVGGSLVAVPMNVESTRVERAYGRSVIPHFHAAFSAGAVAGSILGAGAASVGLPVVAQFAAFSVGVAVLRLAALSAGMVLPGRPQAPSGPPEKASRSAMSVWTEPRTILIGLVAFAATLGEGAANNWLALAVVDRFGTTEAFGGIALGVFIGAMTIVRLAGTRAIDRLGRVASLQLSLVAGLLGLAAFGLAPHPAVALVGAALWGAGAALCFPIAVAAVSDDHRGAQARVSVITSMGSIAVLTAAPLVGVAAEALGGAQQALLVVLIPLAAALFAARWVAPSLTRVADPAEILADVPETVPAS